MADDQHFVGGDFYRIDDRTGFKVRANRTRKEWNGRIVRSDSFEPRQPQDMVRGQRDDQSVPKPRPRQPDLFIAQGVGAQFQVYGDAKRVGGASFLVQNSAASSYNIGTNPASNYKNPSGTAAIQVINGSIRAVRASDL